MDESAASAIADHDDALTTGGGDVLFTLDDADDEAVLAEQDDPTFVDSLFKGTWSP